MESKPELNVWVIHSKLTKARKASTDRLITALQEGFNVNPFYIAEHDADELNLQDVKSIVSGDKVGIPIFDSVQKALSLRHVSNTLKHIKALQQIASSGVGNTVNMVIEDDVVYGDDMLQMLSTIVQKANGHEMIMLGLPYGKVKGEPKVVAFESLANVYNILPSCDSYIITPAGASKMLQHMRPIRFMTNVQLSYAVRASNIDVIMSVPNVFLDGSKLGSHIGTVEVNNPLIYNPEYHALKTMVEDKKPDRDVQDFVKSMKFDKHPEIMYLVATWHVVGQRYTEAKALYDQAYHILAQNAAVLNGSSIFLQQYINMFKYVQSMTK